MTMWHELAFPVDSPKDTVLVIEDQRGNVILDPLRWHILKILRAGKSVMGAADLTLNQLQKLRSDGFCVSAKVYRIEPQPVPLYDRPFVNHLSDRWVQKHPFGI